MASSSPSIEDSETAADVSVLSSDVTVIPQRRNAVAQNQVSTVLLYGQPIVSLFIEGKERLCLAQVGLVYSLVNNFLYH